MNWFSNGFLGVYESLLDERRPLPPENKLKEIKELRLRKFAERAGQGAPAKVPEKPNED